MRKNQRNFSVPETQNPDACQIEGQNQNACPVEAQNDDVSSDAACGCADKTGGTSSTDFLGCADKTGEQIPHIDRSPRKFDLFYMLLVALYVFVMWCTGYNFLPLIAIVLGVVSAFIILVRAVRKKGVGLYLWISYIISICGTFIYFLIWGAESFGRELWWNFVLSLFPVLLALVLLFANKFARKSALNAVTGVCAFLMICTSVVYVLFMDLRAIPTVESLQAGHDDYLNAIKRADGVDANSPNVLVVLMDDMAFSDISAYSYLGSEAATINTPNIDSIADNGVMMDNFYSASPVCSPSRFSILTGRYSSRGYLDNVVFPTCMPSEPYSPTHFLNPYQFLNNVDGILGDEITFAEAMQAYGYRTGCIGKWNLGDYGEYLPTNQGFDYFYGSYYVNDMTPYNWVRDTGGNSPEGVTHKEVRTHKDNLDQSLSTQKFTAEMVDFISSSVENNEKFLAYYTSPWPHYPIYSDNNGSGKGDKTDDTYIDCIEEFDKYLGDILGYLKTTADPNGNGSLYDNTLVVFTSDNGPGREGVTGALRGRKNTTFDGGMKVPLVASYPNGGVGGGSAIAPSSYSYYKWDANGVKSADATVGMTKHIDASSMNFDLFNTILKYCGITTVNQDNETTEFLPNDRIIDGVALNDLWNCTVPTSTRVHDKLFYLKKGKCQAIQEAVELNGKVYDFKYYEKVLTENSAFIDQYYKNYLFNLDLDPAEGYNITPTYGNIANKLNADLLDFRKQMRDNRRGVIPNVGPFEITVRPGNRRL